MKFKRFRDSGIYVLIVINVNKKFPSARRVPKKSILPIVKLFKMSKLHQSEFPATVLLIHKIMPSTIDDKLKCPGCLYKYPNDTIRRHLCPIFDNVKCKGCRFEYPIKSMKRHVFTYYKCKQF